VGTASFVPAQRRNGAWVTPLGSWPFDGAVDRATAAPAGGDGAVLAVFRPESLRFASDGPVLGRRVDAFYRGDHWLHAIEVRGSSGASDGPATHGASVLVRAAAPGDAGAEVRLAALRPAFVPGAAGDPPEAA
jgi:hypothetical protein